MKAALAAAIILASSAAALAKDYSMVLSTTPALVIPAPTNNQRAFFRIVNVGTSGSAWCTRAGTTPAPNTAGSYEVAVGASEEFQGVGNTPTDPTWCVAVAGTVPVTAEAR